MENKAMDVLKTSIDKFVREHNELRKNTLKQILSKIQVFEKAKKSIVLDNSITISIIQKEIKEINESINTAKSANRNDLVIENQSKIDIINFIFSDLFPKEYTEDEIKLLMSQILIEANQIAKDPKNMGAFIKIFKDKYPNQNLGIVSKITKELLTT